MPAKFLFVTDPELGATPPEGDVPALPAGSSTPPAVGRPVGQPLQRSPRPPRQPGFWERLPWSIRIGVPIVVLGAALWIMLRPPPPKSARLSLGSNIVGQDLTRARLTVYPYDDSSNALWPRPAVGAFDWVGPDPFTFGEAQLPGEGIVRIDAEGFGTGFIYLQLADDAPVVDAALGPPASVSAVVKLGDGRPAVGARVLGLGGGHRGVVLCEAVTDESGRFELSGYNADLLDLSLRVTLPGHGVLDYIWYFHADEQDELVLEPTETIRGSIELPDGVGAGGLTVFVRSLPGVVAAVAEDGTFELDGVPSKKVARLLVDGLPRGWTYHRAMARPGDRDVVLEIVPSTTVRGRVVLGQSNQAQQRAVVYHDDGPRGGDTSKTNEFGEFELHDVPPGTVEIRAQVAAPRDPKNPRAYQSYSGLRTLEVTEGEPLEGIIIRVR